MRRNQTCKVWSRQRILASVSPSLERDFSFFYHLPSRSVNNKRGITAGALVEPGLWHWVIEGQSLFSLKANQQDSKVRSFVHFPSWTPRQVSKESNGKKKPKVPEKMVEILNSLSYFPGILKLQIILDSHISDWNAYCLTVFDSISF